MERFEHAGKVKAVLLTFDDEATSDLSCWLAFS